MHSINENLARPELERERERERERGEREAGTLS
jgi:hypothetical protein